MGVRGSISTDWDARKKGRSCHPIKKKGLGGGGGGEREGKGGGCRGGGGGDEDKTKM